MENTPTTHSAAYCWRNPTGAFRPGFILSAPADDDGQSSGGGGGATPPDSAADNPPAGDNDAALRSARAEAAKYRTERNAALREASALRTIATAHNLKLDAVQPESLAKLAIEGGKVVDKFDYTPPKPGVSGGSGGAGSAGEPNGTTPDAGGLTREKIAAMSNDEINKRWDEVQKVLRAK